ncbi:hypothetical protein BH10ACT1_BH10ACT1_32390 [soil metagenome]
MTNRLDLPFKWVEGFNARRPLLPSEMRTTVMGTKRMLPSARADMGSARPMLPWTNRAANDWRGIKP